MKLYVDNNINKNIPFDLLEKKYKLSKRISNEFYSDNGMFTYEKDQLYKITVHDKPIKKIKTKHFTLMVDESQVSKTPCFHMSINHINIVIYKYIYHLANVTAVIECKQNNNKYTPCDMYFTVKNSENLSDTIFNEINVFLSYLN